MADEAIALSVDSKYGLYSFYFVIKLLSFKIRRKSIIQSWNFLDANSQISKNTHTLIIALSFSLFLERWWAVAAAAVTENYLQWQWITCLNYYYMLLYYLIFYYLTLTSSTSLFFFILFCWTKKLKNQRTRKKNYVVVKIINSLIVAAKREKKMISVISVCCGCYQHSKRMI